MHFLRKIRLKFNVKATFTTRIITFTCALNVMQYYFLPIQMFKNCDFQKTIQIFFLYLILKSNLERKISLSVILCFVDWFEKKSYELNS